MYFVPNKRYSHLQFFLMWKLWCFTKFLESKRKRKIILTETLKANNLSMSHLSLRLSVKMWMENGHHSNGRQTNTNGHYPVWCARLNIYAFVQMSRMKVFVLAFGIFGKELVHHQSTRCYGIRNWFGSMDKRRMSVWVLGGLKQMFDPDCGGHYESTYINIFGVTRRTKRETRPRWNTMFVPFYVYIYMYITVSSTR